MKGIYDFKKGIIVRALKIFDHKGEKIKKINKVIIDFLKIKQARLNARFYYFICIVSH